MARAIMIQGTGSNVGKSVLVAGIARAARRRGIAVAPFKPQNMSNNAAVTADGGEIGRAQALQALAAGRDAVVDMNPVLLKPETETGAQVIVHGKRWATMKARDYGTRKTELLGAVMESFGRLAETCELIVVEGAGSPAEINLRAGDIANMGFAEAAGVPVVLVGDIDRGGVIAQLVGTDVVLSENDRARVKGFVINKFRGDVSLFDEGLKEIAARTGWYPLGVAPWFDAAWRLPAEDILDLAERPGTGLKIAVPRLPRIANFDDLDPLAAEPEVEVVIIQQGKPLPGDADIVLIPGSKSTIADLAALRAEGWDVDIAAHLRRGGHVLGLCGGYQMLGQRVADPDGIEGVPGAVEGLGLLDIETVIAPAKRVQLSRATDLASGAKVDGYEIHLGQTTGPDCERGWLTVDDRIEGAASPDGRVSGCYLHGIFSSDAFRAAWLARMGGRSVMEDHAATVDRTLDELADHLEKHLDMDALLDMAVEVDIPAISASGITEEATATPRNANTASLI